MSCGHEVNLETGDRCACSSPADSSRRRWMYQASRLALGGWLLSGGLVRQALAADDLLLPSSIGRSDSGPTPATRKADHASALPSPEDGSYMATTTVSQLGALCLSADGIVRRMAALEQASNKRSQDLQQLRLERNRKLDEFHQGLFCSGCKQTKSEILAKGETFPHSGQTIVRATPEQIRAKDEELSRPIDALEKELARLAKESSDLLNQRDEIFQQISYGVDFWQTGFSYEFKAQELRRAALQEQFSAKRKEMSDLIWDLRREEGRLSIAGAPDRKAIAAAREQIIHWEKALAALERQHEGQLKLIDQEISRTRAKVKLMAAQIESHLAQGDLPRYLTVPVSTATSPPLKAPEALGIHFRRGDFALRSQGQTLPVVASFISKFRSLAFITKGSGSVAPAPAGGLPNRLLDIPKPAESNVPDALLNLP